MSTEMEMGTPGRPRRADRRRRNQGNCLCCGCGLDSLRDYCDATCRKRMQRERDRNRAPMLNPGKNRDIEKPAPPAGLQHLTAEEIVTS